MGYQEKNVLNITDQIRAIFGLPPAAKAVKLKPVIDRMKHFELKDKDTGKFKGWVHIDLAGVEYFEAPPFLKEGIKDTYLRMPWRRWTPKVKHPGQARRAAKAAMPELAAALDPA